MYPAYPETVHNLMDVLGKVLDGKGAAAPMMLVAALSYLSKIVSRCTDEDGSITQSNWYRMTLMAVLCGTKMYNEYTTRRLNKLFALASSIPLKEINTLEVNFLYLLDFSLIVEEKDVQMWVDWMGRIAAQHNLPHPLGDLTMMEIDKFAPSRDTTEPREESLISGADWQTPSMMGSVVDDRNDSEVVEGRLFSVVYGDGDPITPPDLRALSQLQDLAVSPDRSPAKDSPVSFFKCQKSSTATHKKVVPIAAKEPAPSVPAAKVDRSEPNPSRWGMLRSVKEVLSVSASLIAGRLQIISPQKNSVVSPVQPEEEEFVYDSLQANLNTSSTTREPLLKTEAALPILATAEGSSSFYPQEPPVAPYNPEEDEEGYYDEEGNYYYYDEEDYGYYDPAGVFHYYEEEPEEEEEVFEPTTPVMTRAPPRTHSPPAL
ncbi:Cyclin, putative [Angomonas deanei]|uniref:Cyclin, putative n=1 Tax=Angomonas deanei TaxID=59799 RepID=A0A7G2CHU3_9TRYP|nr:Cyclin, putative [Angomonas deanei]